MENRTRGKRHWKIEQEAKTKAWEIEQERRKVEREARDKAWEIEKERMAYQTRLLTAILASDNPSHVKGEAIDRLFSFLLV